MKTAPLPASLQHAEASAHDLDARILQAEQRLIARDENLRRRAAALLGRTRGALQPRRLLAPVLGAAAAGGVLWWLLRGGGRGQGRARALPRAAGMARPAPPLARGEVPWVRLVGLAWPLLPVGWRSRISPGTAAAVVSLGLPLAERLIARRHTPPLDTVPALDVVRFSGRWFEVAHLPSALAPACEGQPVLHYAPRTDGRVTITRDCPDGRGGWRQEVAQGRPLPGSHGAQWRVSGWPETLRWLPGAWRDHWVLAVDEGYGSALVGSPDRGTLVLLSRRPRLAEERLQSLLQAALDRGFDVERLHFSAPP